MRGPLGPVGYPQHEGGITPAYAGTTNCVVSVVIPTWDHPRLCGDHALGQITAIENEGSPPLMRGPLRRCLDFYTVQRITPAYAGTTHPRKSVFPRTWDHPRLCGDHDIADLKTDVVAGSPPLMRGPRMLPRGPSGIKGITPAYAGTTNC